MGCCDDSSVLSKVATVVILVSFVCCTIAIFTPYWSDLESNGTVNYTGLFYTCTNDVSNCFNLDNVLSVYQGTDYYDDFLATLSLQLVGWVGVLVSMVIMIVFSCCLPNKILGWVAVIFMLIGGLCITVSLIIYGASLIDLYNSLLSWSFGLDVAGAALALTAAVLMIINSCIIP
ncbi:uncharacterized protein LOC134273823 [Saccostrea cucullata]|uniref:uncharacterized protein LOC134273823 n=1 Tax=Saccostrea cuccullata TaxID=36930 RepID=UPI002ED2D053